jgi:hypothetical protein
MPKPTSSLRSSSLTPAYRFSERAGRYVDQKGRFVSRAAVRGELDKTLDNASKAMKSVTQAYRDGSLNVLEWRAQMAAQVKTAHLVAAASAKGGWAQMSQSDFGRVGQQLRGQYERLDKFAWQVATGEQKPDGTMLRRAQMYGQAARATYHATEQREQEQRGYDQERNILEPAQHCDGCLAETGRGWVAIGELVPIGSRDCLVNCRCRVAYRNSQTGEETH